MSATSEEKIKSLRAALEAEEKAQETREALCAALEAAAKDQGLAEAEVVKARQKRNQAIRAAVQEGLAKIEVHRISGLSRPTIDTIMSEQDTNQGETQ